MWCTFDILILNVVFYNYITNRFSFQVYLGKIFARMLEVQIRYIQFVLTTSIFIGLLMDNVQLLTAVFVGLILVWQLEMLVGQLRLDTKEYRLILIFISLTFLPVVFNILSETTIEALFYIVLLAVPILGVLFLDLNIFKLGNLLFSTIISMAVIHFIVSQFFQDSITYLTYLFLLLFFIKTIATLFNVQFSNFQYFFDFFAAFIVFVGISSFYDYKITHIVLAGLATALFCVLINLLILKIRFESEYTNELSTQVYLYDYLVGFLLSLYFVDAINIVNGLF
jgi:hypothetical protein